MLFCENKNIFDFDDRIRLGDGVFDTLLIVKENKTDFLIPFPNYHFSRLLDNAEIMHIARSKLPTAEELEKKAINLAIKKVKTTGRYALNTLITRGKSKRGLLPDKNAAPTLHMKITPVPNTFPPIEAIISETVRRNEGSPLSQIKSCNYGDNILALIEAQNKNANEAILLNNKGNVACASVGNIFCCIDNTLITPPLSDGAMDGITRKMILERFDIKAKERSIKQEELENADGIYITNSIKGIRPVKSLNGKSCPEPFITIKQDEHLEHI